VRFQETLYAVYGEAGEAGAGRFIEAT